MGVSFSMQVASTDGQFAAHPNLQMVLNCLARQVCCYHQFPQNDDRGYAALLESANGPDLSREASIGIAWTTNKLNHLRFVAQFYAYIFSGNEGLPCCSPLRSANNFSTTQSPRAAELSY